MVVLGDNGVSPSIIFQMAGKKRVAQTDVDGAISDSHLLRLCVADPQA